MPFVLLDKKGAKANLDDTLTDMKAHELVVPIHSPPRKDGHQKRKEDSEKTQSLCIINLLTNPHGLVLWISHFIRPLLIFQAIHKNHPCDLRNFFDCRMANNLYDGSASIQIMKT